MKVVGEAIAAVDPDADGRHTDTIEDLVGADLAFLTGTPNPAKIYRHIAVGARSSTRGSSATTSAAWRGSPMRCAEDGPNAFFGMSL